MKHLLDLHDSDNTRAGKTSRRFNTHSNKRAGVAQFQRKTKGRKGRRKENRWLNKLAEDWQAPSPAKATPTTTTSETKSAPRSKKSAPSTVFADLVGPTGVHALAKMKDLVSQNQEGRQSDDVQQQV